MSATATPVIASAGRISVLEEQSRPPAAPPPAYSHVEHVSVVLAPVVVHTGHWGTGAYGGDKVVMALVQRLAARLSGVSTLVFHAVDEDGAGEYRRAVSTEATLLPTGEAARVDEVLGRIEGIGLRWGTSDGN